MAVKSCLRLGGDVLLVELIRLLEKTISKLCRAIGFYDSLLLDRPFARIVLSFSLHDRYSNLNGLNIQDGPKHSIALCQ